MILAVLFFQLLALIPGKTASSDTVIVSFTPEEQAYLNHKKEIRYAVDPDYLPFEAVNKRGEHIGMSADLLALFKERSGITFRLVPSNSWPQTLDMARRREIDLIALAAESDERKNYLAFTTPYIEVQAVIATLMHRPFYSDISEILDKKIGVVKGYSFKEQLLKRYPSLQLVDVATVNDGLMRVQAGELYGVVGNMATIGHRIQEAKMNNVKIAGRVEGDVYFHVATRNDEPVLGNIMQKLVSSMKREEIQEMNNRWWGVRYEVSTDYSLVWKILAGFLVAVAAISFWLVKVGQLNRRLKMVNAQLEELNTQKDYYFSVIGHDLRNPFMSIVGYAETLHEDLDKLPRETAKKMAGTIREKSSQVLGMFNQLLDWARLEINQIETRTANVLAAELVDGVFKLYALNASAKGIKLLNTVSPELELKTDPYMMSAILRNLVSNAIKYSGKDDLIKVGFDFTQFAWFVQDTGAGMDVETQKQLFDLKPRKSKAGTANEAGTGLGLTICLRYASKLGASLSVQSEPGLGTTFFVKMPK